MDAPGLLNLPLSELSGPARQHVVQAFRQAGRISESTPPENASADCPRLRIRKPSGGTSLFLFASFDLWIRSCGSIQITQNNVFSFNERCTARSQEISSCFLSRISIGRCGNEAMQKALLWLRALDLPHGTKGFEPR